MNSIYSQLMGRTKIKQNGPLNVHECFGYLFFTSFCRISVDLLLVVNPLPAVVPGSCQLLWPCWPYFLPISAEGCCSVCKILASLGDYLFNICFFLMFFVKFVVLLGLKIISIEKHKNSHKTNLVHLTSIWWILFCQLVIQKIICQNTLWLYFKY